MPRSSLTMISTKVLEGMTAQELKDMIFADARACMGDYEGPLKYTQSEHAKVTINGVTDDLYEKGLVAFIVEPDQ